MDDAIEQSCMRKIYIRLLPFAVLSYFLAYVDRINVSFAALTMRADLGMSAEVFGFAVGTFYWGYFIFEVPSNIIMEKVGARIWIARIMITWGLVSAANAFVQTPAQFHVVRFLLGVAEAGFFPGVIYYLTYWYPTASRGRSVGLFYYGAPLALTFGGPLSGFLVAHDAFGLHGWQVMFLVEGLIRHRILPAEDRHGFIETIRAYQASTRSTTTPPPGEHSRP